jgi:hypothetical protein
VRMHETLSLKETHMKSHFSLFPLCKVAYYIRDA